MLLCVLRRKMWVVLISSKRQLPILILALIIPILAITLTAVNLAQALILNKLRRISKRRSLKNRSQTKKSRELTLCARSIIQPRNHRRVQPRRRKTISGQIRSLSSPVIRSSLRRIRSQTQLQLQIHRRNRADQDKKYDIGPPDALEILELINYARSKENLKPFKMYEPLNRTAQWMVNDMKENNYFSHYKPGTTIPHGLLKARAVCNAPVENLVQTSPPDLHTSRVAFNAWMQSPPHRQSIMSSTYMLTGFGIAGNKIVEYFY